MKENSTKRQYTMNEFADNFNSLPNNPVIEKDNESHIIPTEPSNEIIMSVEDTKAAIPLLKGNKSANPFFVVGEHVIYAENEKLYMWMTNFYNSIFKTQCTPESLSKSSILHFVKSYKKTLKSFNNYRGIRIHKNS